MTDLLSQRLITAKQELTSLKTAHRRGLGLVKIYTFKVTIDNTGHESSSFLTLNINFDQRFAPYPFADGLVSGQADYAYLINQGYSGGGFKMYQEFLWIQDSGLSEHSILVFSSSPISSVKYSWG